MRKRIVLAANPSFATVPEQSFWLQFERTLMRRGWVLAKHAMRKIPDSDTSFVLPARLIDLARYLPEPPIGHKITRLPDWVASERFDTLVEWEMRRWQIRRPNFQIGVGLKKLAWHVDGLFRVFEPAATLVTNKIDHGTALFDWAGRHYGSKVIFFERSPLDTFIAESEGMFLESDIWERYAARDKALDDRRAVSGQSLLNLLRDNPEGFRQQNHKTVLAKQKLAQIDGPIFLLPMDNVLWTGWAQDDHWQRGVDYYPGTPSPSETIDKLAGIAASLGGTLVVKTHPSDLESYTYTASNVLFLNTSLALLLEKCDVCVSFLTKVTFVAQAVGCPTVTLAPNTAAASEGTYHTQDISKWADTITQALRQEKDPGDMRRKAAILAAWLKEEVYVDSNLPANFANPNIKSFTDSICDSPEGQKSFGNYQMLKEQVTKVKRKVEKRQVWLHAGSEGTVGDDTSLRIIFDVSRLANTRLLHSGISRYAMQIFSALTAEESVTVIPTLMNSDILERGEFRNNLHDFSEFLGAPVRNLSQALEQAGNNGNAVILSPYDPLPPPDKTGRLPRVMTIHDVLHLTQSELYLDPKIAAHIEEVIANLTVMDWVMTDSEYTRMQLHQVCNHPMTRSVTVPLAASTVFRPADDDSIRAFRKKHGLGDTPYFVVFAQNDPRKNYPTIAEVIIRHVRDNPDQDYAFVIMRSSVSITQIDPFPDDVKQRVTFVNGPEDTELTAAYSGALGALYISLGEGFGLPPLEAMQCGCPVITTAIGSIPEVTRDAALYVDPSNIKQIGEAIASLAGSESLRNQMRSRALKCSAEYSWQRTAREILDVVRQALVETPPIDLNIRDNYRIMEPASSDWIAMRGRVDPSGMFFDIGEGEQPVVYFQENNEEGVHALWKKFDWPSTAEEPCSPDVSIMVRAMERSYLVIWLEAFAENKQLSQIEIYFDLGSSRCLTQRMTGLNGIDGITIKDVGDGWRSISIKAILPEPDATELRFGVGARSGTAGSSAYKGNGMICFEIASAIISSPASAIIASPEEKDAKPKKGIDTES